MTDEEYEEMLKRGYMTDEDWGEISRESEKAWDEWEASRAKEEKMRREFDEQEEILLNRRATEEAECRRLLRLEGKEMDEEGWIHKIHH